MRTVWLMTAVALSAVACGDSAVRPSTGPETTSTASDTDGTRAGQQSYRLQCYAEDGRLVGDFSRLEEVWASPNYTRTEHCTVSFTGTEPVTLGSDEERTARIAAQETGGSLPDAYLTVLEACARLGAEAGPHSIAGTAEPVLRAALAECPESPQSGLIASQLGASGASETEGES